MIDHALPIARRDLFRAGAIGLAGLAVPVLAQGAQGFSHGVASGEPGPSQVLLWTRYVAAQDETLKWEIAEDEQFTRIAAQGDAQATPGRDWCAKAWATRLRPGRQYWYRFVDKTGARSPVGRTKTLPRGRVARYRIAVFSCSNIGFGWFNAYAHAAGQASGAGDFDLAVHLGDYIYEQRRGVYPSPLQALEGRPQPLDEAVTLAGYRERYAAYRSDPDLQRLHQMFPMVVIRDDHESANDAWKDGAEGHQADEGEWSVRKAIAEQVWREWLPVSDEPYARYEIGNLATLFRLENRHIGRDQPPDLIAAAAGGTAGLTAFRDNVWRDPARTMLGATQEGWLRDGLRRSARARKPWQVLVQQVIMGTRTLPGLVSERMPTALPGWIRDRITAAVGAGAIGLPWSMDMWDGFPAARERLWTSALDADANLLVLAGDSHNAWAFDHDLGGERVGVEMAGHSVTSPGAESTIPWVPAPELAPALVGQNPQLKWCDTGGRGYMALELTPRSATGEWRFLSSVRERGTTLSGTRRMTVLAGQRKFSA